MTLELQRTVGMGGEPRVDLMPPILADRARARGVRRWLVLIVALAVLVVAVGYLLAGQRATQAQNDLVAAQTETLALLAQRSQYTDVTAAAGALAAIDSGSRFAVSTEVLWADLYDQIDARLPDGASLAEVTLIGRAPWDAASVPESPLRAPREATVTLTVVTLTVPDASDMVSRLGDVTGFVDATPTTVELANGVYRTEIVLNVGAEALSGRFASTEGQVQQ